MIGRHPGPWEIAFQQRQRRRPRQFWRAVADEAWGDAWTEDRGAGARQARRPARPLDPQHPHVSTLRLPDGVLGVRPPRTGLGELGRRAAPAGPRPARGVGARRRRRADPRLLRARAPGAHAPGAGRRCSRSACRRGVRARAPRAPALARPRRRPAAARRPAPLRAAARAAAPRGPRPTCGTSRRARSSAGLYAPAPRPGAAAAAPAHVVRRSLGRRSRRAAAQRTGARGGSSSRRPRWPATCVRTRRAPA